VAYAEICSSTYEHLLELSYEWHTKKKVGVVMRSMDRGTDAADTGKRRSLTGVTSYLCGAL
jgi:ABC-type transport system involved in Fe-S cluster assembly fused permease/ATPase subunit